MTEGHRVGRGDGLPLPTVSAIDIVTHYTAIVKAQFPRFIIS